MNTTIINVNDNTMNLKVRELTQKMIANKGKLFKAVFTKKDGSLRTMTFSVNTNWNPLNGITTTKSGAKMIATKCANNCITVLERVMDGHFEPRCVTLDKVISLDVLR